MSRSTRALRCLATAAVIRRKNVSGSKISTHARVATSPIACLIERRRVNQDVVALERFDLAAVPRQRELCVIEPAVPLMPGDVQGGNGKYRWLPSCGSPRVGSNSY